MNKKLKPEGWPEQGRNVVFYPRQYHIDPKDEKNSFVTGISLKAVPFRMYLRLNPLYKKKIYNDITKVPPKLTDFARTERHATKACIAVEDNGPGPNREGILLFSRVFPVENKVNTFEAGWCTVLANDRHSPEPVLGYGRMEIRYGDPRFDSDEIKNCKQKIHMLRKKLAQLNEDHDEYQQCLADIETAEDHLREIQPMRFVGIIEGLEDIVTIKKPGQQIDRKQLKACCLSLMKQYTSDDGRYGGCIIRTVTPERTVNLRACGKMAIHYRKEIIIAPDAVFDQFMRFNRGQKMLHNIGLQDTVDIIPFQQTNCGPRGNALYRQKTPFNTIRRTYFDHDKGITRDAPIAIRLSKAPSNGNMLLGSIYATGKPIGNILCLDRAANSAFKLVS